jgi:hypothetical protein
MKRLLPLVLLSFLFLPSHAAGDGCPAETCGVQSVAVAGAPVLLLRPYGTVVAYDLVTGKRRFAAPYGLASANGRSFYVSANPRGRTRVRRRDAWTGRVERSWMLGPKLGLTAVSADGRYVALTDARSNRRRTGFAVLDTKTGRQRAIELRGNFSPEAVSRDGKRLFVIQYVRHGYRVRLYDLVRRVLRRGELRPRNEDEPMRGYPAYAIGSPDGHWLLTLYVKPKQREAFVHALDLERAVAYCIDLPGRGNSETLAKYALTLSPDGRTLFVANPRVGSLAAIDLPTLEIEPVIRFRPSSSRGQYTNAAVSPRSDLLYFGGLDALWAYDVRARRVRGPYEPGRIGGFAFTPDGRKLTVITPGGRAFWLDAATGRRLY